MMFTNYEILEKDAMLARWGEDLILVRLMEDGTKKIIPIHIDLDVISESGMAVDRKYGVAYVIDNGGRLLTIDKDGEVRLEAEAETLYDLRDLQFADGKLYARAYGGLFEWNLAERYLRLVRRLDRETEHREGLVTIGGMYMATENGHVYRLSDGMTIRKPKDKRREREEERFLSWVAPKAQKNRLAVFNANRNILYQYAVAEDNSLYCAGHSFLEHDVFFPYAICTDQENNTLKIFGACGIEFFNLESGERKQKTIELPDGILGRRPRFRIAEAEFAPGGESLELIVVYQNEDIFPFMDETVVFCWNFVTGTVVERQPESKDVNRYVFDLGDIMRGDDSGLRYPVYYPKDDIAYWRRNCHQEDLEMEDFDEDDYNPELGIMKKFKAFRGKIGEKVLESRGWIACPVIFHGEYYGGLGSEGDTLDDGERGVDFLFWDAEKERMVGYRNALTEDDLEEGEIIPFDGGFLLRNGDKLVRYRMDKWKLETCKPKDRVDYLWAGCADGAVWNRMYRWWEKHDDK